MFVCVPVSVIIFNCNCFSHRAAYGGSVDWADVNK